MGLDCFVKFANIEGESKVKNHEGWIECQSFSVGVSSRGGHTTELQEFSFSHKIDKASPKLAQACCADEDLGKVVIHLLEEGKLYMEYTLEPGARSKGADAHVLRVASVNPAGSEGGEGRPAEDVSIRYGKLKWKYAEGNIEGSYDASVV